MRIVSYEAMAIDDNGLLCPVDPPRVKRLVLAIHIAGCDRECPQCPHPSFHNFGEGMQAARWLDQKTKAMLDNHLQHVWITGGDFMRHPANERAEFLRKTRVINNKREYPFWLWLFTGADFKLVDTRTRDNFMVLRCGQYEHSLRECPDNPESMYANVSGMRLRKMSANQNFYIRDIPRAGEEEVYYERI